MIFICNSEGTIQAVSPSSINQGSVSLTELILLAPVPKQSVVQAMFKLPNGLIIRPQLLTQEEYDYNLSPLEQINSALKEKGLTAWSIKINKAITQFYGTLTVSFLITGEDAIITTTEANIPINKSGTALPIPVTEEDISTITGYLNAALAARDNAERAAGEAQTAVETLAEELPISIKATENLSDFTIDLELVNNDGESVSAPPIVTTIHLPSIRDGEGEGSIVIGDGEAYGENSLAQGTGAIAGATAYRISGVTATDSAVLIVIDISEGGISNREPSECAVFLEIIEGDTSRNIVRFSTPVRDWYALGNGVANFFTSFLDDFPSGTKINLTNSYIYISNNPYSGPITLGNNAFASGTATKAIFDNSTALGEGTHTSRKNQLAIGEYNADSPNALLIVGNGTAEENSNAFEVKEDGRATISKAPINDMDVVNYGIVQPIQSSVTDLTERIEVLEKINLTYSEVDTDTGIIPTPDTIYVGKKAFLNSFGGMTRRWEGYTYTATAGTSYGVYSYGVPFMLSAGNYRLVGGMDRELHINGALVSNPFTLTETTEITSFYEESGAVVGDGSTHTIYPYLLDIDTNTAIPFPNTWLGLQDSKPTAIKIHGANLIKYPYYETTKTENGITFTDNGDGTITVNGTATSVTTFISNKFGIGEGTYTISGCPTAQNGDLNINVRLYNEATQRYTQWILDKNNTPQSGNLIEPKTVSVAITVYAGTTVNNIVFKPMLNIGTTALPYVPYKEPVTKPIPDAIQNLPNYGKGVSADYCNKVDLEAQTYTEQMETYTLTGNENWQPAANGRMLIPTADTPLNKSAVLNTAVCNRFTLVPYAQITTSPVGSFCILSGGGIQFITNFSTVSEWKTWLAEQNGQGNPVIIAYAKAEATTTELPVELDGLVEVERGGFIEIVTDTGKGVPASATFVIPRE